MDPVDLRPINFDMAAIKKITYLLLILLGAAFIVHTLIYLIPGDPAIVIAGEYADPEDIESIRNELSLNDSFIQRYFTFIKRLFFLDLGKSIYSGIPVTDTIIERFPVTLLLACSSMLIACIFGIALGIFCAVFKNTCIDSIILSISSIFISTPIFVTCFILLLIFSYYLNIFPPSGLQGLDPAFIILPSFALASRSLALIIRIVRNELISVLKENYIRTARSLGFPETRVLLIFGFKNIVVPTLAIVLLDFGAYLGGAVVTESVFSWPGIGRLLIVALYKRDIPVIQGVILFGTVLFIFVGFTIDLLQKVITRKAD